MSALRNLTGWTPTAYEKRDGAFVLVVRHHPGREVPWGWDVYRNERLVGSALPIAGGWERDAVAAMRAAEAARPR